MSFNRPRRTIRGLPHARSTVNVGAPGASGSSTGGWAVLRSMVLVGGSRGRHTVRDRLDGKYHRWRRETRCRTASMSVRHAGAVGGGEITARRRGLL